jgi:hypothetical protein
MYVGVALSDTLAIKSEDLLNNHFSHHHFSPPSSRINGTVSNDSTTSARNFYYIRCFEEFYMPSMVLKSTISL